MTTATASLETVFAEICAKHDLTSLSVSYSTQWSWSANCHWDGYSNDGLTCASSHYVGDVHTPQSAIASALRVAASKRTPLTDSIAALEIEQVPA